MRRLPALILFVLAILSSSIAFAQTGDTDGDGVGDARDRCPTTAGPTALMGCPDGDNDGVADVDDACAAVPGVPENRGCPPDSDGDGVGDFEDRCPTEGGPSQNGGCPLPATHAETIAPTSTPSLQLNPLIPPADGPCVAAPYLAGRVNARNAPGATAEVVAILEPNVLYPVRGLVALPDEEESYLVIKLEDLIVTSIAPAGSTGPFDPAFLGGVFVAASTMKIGGDCGPTPVALLVPAIQKVRQAAARAYVKTAKLFVRKSGGVGEYMKIRLTDILVSSLLDTSAGHGTGSGAGKVSYSDLSFIVATVIEGEDGAEVLFDMTEVDPSAASADYLLLLDDIKGESSDEAAPTPVMDAILQVLVLAAKLNDGSESSGDAATCEGQAIDQLKAQGATVQVMVTDSGLDFVLALPDGSQPDPIPPCAAAAGGEISIESFSWGNNPQGSLVKVGPGVLTLGNGMSFSDDGAVCIDMQPADSPPLCVPTELPAVQ